MAIPDSRASTLKTKQHFIWEVSMGGQRILNRDDHFWSLVDRSNGPDACWPWLGCKRGRPPSKTGIRYGGFWDGKRRVMSHRYAYMITYGMPHAKVLHKCDNPICCNPKHLFDGTDADNMRDRDAKRRNSHGENHPDALLTCALVIEIRASVAAGATRASWARKLGVSASAIEDVVNRRSWRKVK